MTENSSSTRSKRLTELLAARASTPRRIVTAALAAAVLVGGAFAVSHVAFGDTKTAGDATADVSVAASSASPSSSSASPSASPSLSPSPTPRQTSQAASRGGARTSPTPSKTTTKAAKVTSSGSCGASYYDEPQETANGETFDPNALTAASKTLAFNTKVRVTSLDTGKSVTVRINDRGPYIDGRCLDLSRAAFDAIDDLGKGAITVKYEILG